MFHLGMISMCWLPQLHRACLLRAMRELANTSDIVLVFLCMQACMHACMHACMDRNGLTLEHGAALRCTMRRDATEALAP